MERLIQKPIQPTQKLSKSIPPLTIGFPQKLCYTSICHTTHQEKNMAKSKDTKKETKKAPQKTAKEKKLAKQEKKNSK